MLVDDGYRHALGDGQFGVIFSLIIADNLGMEEHRQGHRGNLDARQSTNGL